MDTIGQWIQSLTLISQKSTDSQRSAGQNPHHGTVGRLLLIDSRCHVDVWLYGLLYGIHSDGTEGKMTLTEIEQAVLS